MKKLTLLIGLALLVAACHKPIVPELTISGSNEVTVSSAGETVSIDFTTNVPWNASLSVSDWATITPASGEAGTCKIKVAVLKNDNTDDREATLTINAVGEEYTKNATVKIKQTQKNSVVAPGDAIEVTCDAQDINVALSANVDYTITSNDAWLTVVKTKAMSNYTAVLHVDLNKGEVRTGTAVVSADGVKAEITVKQAAFKPVFEVTGLDDYGYIYVGKEGGESSFTITSNLQWSAAAAEQYDWTSMKTSGDKVTFTTTENKTYNQRVAYVTITSKDYQVPVLDSDNEPIAGQFTDFTYTAALIQAGIQYEKYSISMYDMQFDTWGTKVISQALYNGKHYVTNGTELYEIQADGKYSKIEWFCGSGLTQKVITNDDAGNLIVCNHTAYENSEYLDGYFVVNVVTPAGKESNLITKAAWECGGPFGAKLRVNGNVLENAIISAPVEGIVDITMATEIGYWEIKNGTVGEYAKLAVSGISGTWSCAAWSTYPNNFPTVFAKGLTAADGFILSGMYEDNKYYNVAADGTAAPILLPDPVQDGNYAYQSMDIIQIGSHAYMACLASTFFPSWGLTPVVSLVDLYNFNAGGVVHDVALFNVYGKSYFSADWDYGISAASDIIISDAGNGKVGIFLTDLNGRSVEAYEVDPTI